jgi:PAS domain S-box-containing protein
LALLTAAYFGAAKVGLTMAVVAEQVTAVWPPTGIALAALLVCGYRTWPAITLGAFLANATANAPPGAAAAIALGNTLEALLGAWLLRRGGFDHALGRAHDVFALVALAAGLSTAVSATVGATSLCLAGIKPWPAYAALWSVWWLGDAMGDLVVAPLLLTWAGWRRPPWRPRRVAEAGALLLGLAAVSLLVFAGSTALFSFPALVYTVFPFAIWAALRFGQPAATLMTFVASSIAIGGTARGHGPFAFPATHENLILLLIFLGVVAVTTLVLAAVTAERERAKGALQESYDLLRAVTEGTTDAVFVKDRRGLYLMINAAGARFLGKVVAEVLGKDDTELFSPETAQEIMRADRRVMAAGEAQTFEDVGTAAGVTRTYLSTKVPYRDARSNVVGVLGISRDISERKRAERRLAAAHAVTSALARSASLAEAAASVLRTVGETLRCDLGVLWRADPAAGVLRCAEVWHAPGVEGTEFERFSRQITFARGEGLPGRAWGTGELTWAPDAPFPRSVAAQRQGPCGALALPLQSEDSVLGVLEFFSPGLCQPDAGLVPMLADLGSQVAQFIQRRQAEMVLHVRERELSLARAIQQGLLPKAPPAVPGFEIAGATHPAQETGGDYFDFIPLPGGDWGVALGDASGHGIGAALLMAAARAYLRALALTHTGPDKVLDRVNRRLAEDVTADHFVTLFLARLSPRTRSLVYSSAGHVPGYVFDGRGEVRLVLRSTGVPLGVGPTEGFPQGPEALLGPGDLVLLLSDGIVEARSGGGQLFGAERALRVVRAHRGQPAGDIVAALVQEARAWSPAPPADDMTAVVLKTGGAGD